MSFLLPSFEAEARITDADRKNLINLAGKQRMLIQKMSKEAALIALGVNVQQNLINLKQSRNLFDNTLKGIRDGDKSLGLIKIYKGMLIRKLNTIEEIWQNFRKPIDEILLTGTASKEDIREIFDLNIELLKQANIFVRFAEVKLATAGDPNIAKLINVSGRQRMLSQKMSKEFFFAKLGYKGEINKENLQKTIKLFTSSLEDLISGNEKENLMPAPTSKIANQLYKVKEVWDEMKENLEPILIGTANYENVVNVERLNMQLLKESNKAVQLYEKL
jgi:hypothetical protein